MFERLKGLEPLTPTWKDGMLPITPETLVLLFDVKERFDLSYSTSVNLFIQPVLLTLF